MKANELRIGYNYQLEDGVLGGGIATIKNKHDLDIAFDLLESNLIKPIPLTEEWLLKFGFEKDSDNSMVKNDIAIFLDKRFRTNLFLRDNQENKWFSFNFKVKYMHQLQNLYFALTGDELKIK